MEKKIFIEMDCGETFEVKEPPPVGRWKEIERMSLEDWVSLVDKLRSDIVDRNIKIYELKSELYNVREGLEN